MTKITKFVLIAAITTAGVAAPAFAQTNSDDRLIAAQSHHNMPGRHGGLSAFDMLPRSAYDPALTGGGSAGYNENLKTDAW